MNPPHPSQTFLSQIGAVIAARSRVGSADDPYDWKRIARPKQLAPPPEAAPAGQWLIWLLKPGRGFGKTRSLAEWCRDQVFHKGKRFGALVGPTIGKVEQVMITNKKSGLLAICPPHERPQWIPSKHLLLWPNGAETHTYTAEEPEGLRGPEHDHAWADEVDSWAYTSAKVSPKKAMDTMDNLIMSCRLPSPNGEPPQIAVSSTPKRGRIVAMLLKRAKTDGDVVVTSGSTHENRENLDPLWFASIIRRYSGTPLGRQEIYGELLEDITGALWTQDRLDAHRIQPSHSVPPDLLRAVVAVDPAGSKKRPNAETGIVGAGKGANGHGYLTHDRSGRLPPEIWGLRAVELYTMMPADLIIGETNYGGDMVKATITAVSNGINFKAVTATRGKAVRAEPIAALEAQGLIHMVGDLNERAESPFAILEAQLCAMTLEGYQGGMGEDESPSPDRADAYVWAMTELLLGGTAGGILIPRADGSYR